MNIDYKIATKAISNRIKKVLPNIIDASQTGFIAGRYIGENIRLLLDTIEQTEKEDIPGLLFFTDFEKAFDSIDHAYIFRTLEFLNFGPSLIQWIKTFYNNCNSYISNNGFMSGNFNIKRGVRQGCPLSPCLFIICIELLSHAIRTDQGIKGIKLYDKELKNTLFADDAVMLLDGTEDSLRNVLHIIDEFYKISGLKLNASKSTILRIGNLKNTNLEFFREKQIKWTSTSAKTLGITFHTDSTKILELNFEPKLKEFHECLKKWKKRNLSVLGKITVIKSFALPKLIYPLSLLVTPSKEKIAEINKIMFQFLWNSNTDKISRKTIVKKIEEGGLKMINLDFFIIALKASWVKRLLDPINKGPWKYKYESILKKYGTNDFFKCNLKWTDVKLLDIECEFLKNILESWCKINYLEPLSISKQIIWNNSSILSNRKPIFIQEWNDLGVKYVEQLYNRDLNRFHSFVEFKDIYLIKNSDFLKYHKIINAIPQEWKETLQFNLDIDSEGSNLVNKLISNKKICSFLYNMQLANLQNNIKAHMKWEQLFDQTELNWKEIHETPFKCTIDTKLRYFQYKIIMSIIATNRFLFKCKIIGSNLCDFCVMHQETLTHLFYECPYVQEFWGQIKRYLEEKGIVFELSLKNILLGTQNGDKLSNFIILCAKYYIYTCKLNNKVPNVVQFKNVLNERKQVEKIIAIKNDKLEKHNKKWSKFPE